MYNQGIMVIFYTRKLTGEINIVKYIFQKFIWMKYPYFCEVKLSFGKHFVKSLSGLKRFHEFWE